MCVVCVMPQVEQLNVSETRLSAKGAKEFIGETPLGWPTAAHHTPWVAKHSSPSGYIQILVCCVIVDSIGSKIVALDLSDNPAIGTGE